MTREYQLTQEQHERLMNASKPTPAMFFAGGQSMFSSATENAEREWQRLGRELKFKWWTVKPVRGKSDYFFTATPEEDA